MVAVSRFVKFSTTGDTFASAVDATAASNFVAKGSRGFSRAIGANANSDSFTVVLSTTDQFTININGVGSELITLASGTNLDPRFVARDIEYKVHAVSADPDPAYKFSQCKYRNGGINGGSNTEMSLIIYSGVVGSGTSGSNKVTITSGPGRDVIGVLGFDSEDSQSGLEFDYSAYTGVAVPSGAYGGQFDDAYHIQICDFETVGIVSSTGNTYAGTATAGGIFIGSSDDTYTVTVATSVGTSMGQGTGNVPTFTVTSTSDTNNNVIEMLYADFWYDVGTSNGPRIKFTDAVFANGDDFTIACVAASGAAATVGTAKYIWDNDLGDDSSRIQGVSPVTTAVAGSRIGTRGVTLHLSNSGNLNPGERFTITCRGPQPTDTNVTQLNFGNVTVSTQSAVQTVWFELISGAVSMSTVKFSLQSDGTFQHHDQNDGDTEFHFGTVGAGNAAPGTGGNDQPEFPVTTAISGTATGRIVATDIDQNSPVPTYLFATKGDLAVVSSADASEDIGNFQGAVVSDFIFLAIKLGANEVGANSTINYRMFFDFS